jgi:hypothetical protein
MSWTSKASENGNFSETSFQVERGGNPIPGVYWCAKDKDCDRLVLLGHGGTAHKKVEYIEQMAFAFAQKGIATMAIDGPGHGDRATQDFSAPDAFSKAWHEGGGTTGIIQDWKVALDFIESEKGACPTGWWGLSMGTMMGLPVCAFESRIRVALLGLMGTWGPNKQDLIEFAPKLSCPVRFLVQWDDEVVPRDDCIELFGMLGSKRKTLHANPGAHSAVPLVENKASVEYLDHYLK